MTTTTTSSGTIHSGRFSLMGAKFKKTKKDFFDSNVFVVFFGADNDDHDLCATAVMLIATAVTLIVTAVMLIVTFKL